MLHSILHTHTARLSLPVIFFIVFSGFGFAYAHIFELNQDFRCIATAFQSLFRMLLGDLGADTLFKQEPFVAPILYFMFVATCTLVTFNILISILMDGWAEAKQRAADMDDRKKQEQHIDITRSFWEFVASLPVLHYLSRGAVQQAFGEERAVILLQRFYRLQRDSTSDSSEPPSSSESASSQVHGEGAESTAGDELEVRHNYKVDAAGAIRMGAHKRQQASRQRHHI
jgi:hypothetical protein